MGIKHHLVKVAEKVTGRRCNRCLHNCRGRCVNPDGRMFVKCWQSITRPGFEKRPPRYLRHADPTDTERLKAKAQQHLRDMTPQQPSINMTAADLRHIQPIEPAPLTAEQRYQLEKIKATLQQAEETARESGLLED